MSQPNTTPTIPVRYEHLCETLQAHRDDPLVKSFLSRSRDVIFDEDGDLLLTVGNEDDWRNFRVRSCLLRQHSSRFDSQLGPLCLEASTSNNPIRCSIRYDDVSTFFLILLCLHHNIWCSSPLPLWTLVCLARTTYFFQFDKELPDGSSPLRKALEHYLASAAARLDEDDLVSRWTLMKCAFFVGDRASFAGLGLELVRRHKGFFWDLEAQQGALLGHDETLTTYLAVPDDRDSQLLRVLAELTQLRRRYRNELNDLYNGDIYDLLFDKTYFPEDNLLDIPAPPTLVDIDMSNSTENTAPVTAKSMASTSLQAIKQCTCGWLPTYYTSWFERVDSSFPFPLDTESHSLDMAYLPFRNFLLRSSGEEVVQRPWIDCPADKKPKECEMSPQEHHRAGEELRRELAMAWANWEQELKAAVMAWGEKRGLAMAWKPWEMEESETEEESEMGEESVADDFHHQ